MKCPKCQFENRATAEFCGECGFRLEALCPECKNSAPTAASLRFSARLVKNVHCAFCHDEDGS